MGAQSVMEVYWPMHKATSVMLKQRFFFYCKVQFDWKVHIYIHFYRMYTNRYLWSILWRDTRPNQIWHPVSRATHHKRRDFSVSNGSYAQPCQKSQLWTPWKSDVFYSTFDKVEYHWFTLYENPHLPNTEEVVKDLQNYTTCSKGTEGRPPPIKETKLNNNKKTIRHRVQ